jgi:hypothetical protein
VATEDVNLTRRNFIRLGWGGAVLLTVGGVGLALQPTVMREPRQKLKVLSPTDFSVLAAIVDRLHPGAPGLPSGWDLQVPEKVDAFLWTIHPADNRELLKALRFIENAIAGALLDGRFRPFTALSPEAQDEALASWRTSRLQTRRLAFKGIRSLTASVYWSQPATYAHLGYPGPPDFGNYRPRGEATP